MIERNNGVFSWFSSFNSPLEMNKSALVDFTTKSNYASILVLNQRTHNTATTHRIKASPSAKLLGVILDSKLNWMRKFMKRR
jgi:hypothetical protein